MSSAQPSVDPRGSVARGSTEYVQPIGVLKTGSHWSTVRAVAVASVLAYLDDSADPAWGAWLSGPFAKSVRRGDEAAMRRLRGCAPHVEVRIGDAVAVATRPFAYEDLPKAAAKLQVAGTDFPREASPDVPAPVFTVYLNASLAMTTGKSAAQAAHAVFLMVSRHLNDQEVARWRSDVTSFAVRSVSAERMLDLAADAPVVINDAGHTEVDPGSLTALAVR